MASVVEESKLGIAVLQIQLVVRQELNTSFRSRSLDRFFSRFWAAIKAVNNEGKSPKRVRINSCFPQLLFTYDLLRFGVMEHLQV